MSPIERQTFAAPLLAATIGRFVNPPVNEEQWDTAALTLRLQQRKFARIRQM
jgi:hypothetical protein